MGHRYVPFRECLNETVCVIQKATTDVLGYNVHTSGGPTITNALTRINIAINCTFHVL